jgi:hypothetical protein
MATQDSTRVFKLRLASASIRNASVVMTGDRLNALIAAKQIDRSNKYLKSERGFNTSMRVSSDRPSQVKRWSEGMTVGFQRTTYGAETSAKAYRHATAASEWHRRKREQELLADAKRRGEVTTTTKSRALRVPPGRTVAEVLFA